MHKIKRFLVIILIAALSVAQLPVSVLTSGTVNATVNVPDNASGDVQDNAACDAPAVSNAQPELSEDDEVQVVADIMNSVGQDTELTSTGEDGETGFIATSETVNNSELITQHSSYMKKISSGPDYTLAITSDGRVAAWGDNAQGQCTVPYDLADVIEVSAGAYHALALREDGTVSAWGYNEYGQCNVPADLIGVIGVAAGGSHSLALKADGTVVSWGGYNPEEEPYRHTVPENLTQPAKANIIAIAAGGDHSLALKTDGTVVVWGSNSWNQLQIPDELTTAETANVAAIAAPWGHNLAIRKDGTVIAWGYNIYGQATVPEGLNNVVAVDGSNFDSIALKADGTIITWGDNTPGILNPPPEAAGAIAIACQQTGAVALKLDNTLTSWGITEVPDGISLLARPGIIHSYLDIANQYIDIYFSTGIYGAGKTPISNEAFGLIFENNGGYASGASIASTTKQDGSSLTGGETVVRVDLSTIGYPSGEETIEISIPEAYEVYDSAGTLMEDRRTTGPVRLKPVSPKPITLYLAPDNSYVDIEFNMGIYGGSNHSPVELDDFTIIFSQNTGTATGIMATSIINPETDEALIGGENTIRFLLEIEGSPNGDETIVISSSSNEAIYSYEGIALLQNSTTKIIQLNPPEMSFVEIRLAEDNSYLDMYFNTGIYGDWEFVEEKLIGKGPVDLYRFDFICEDEGILIEEISAISLKRPDNTIESEAYDLEGGEKVIRMFLDLGGREINGTESVAIRVESVFSKSGQSYNSMEPEHTTYLNALPLFTSVAVGDNNTYIDVYFNMGVYGAADGTSPVDKSDFILNFYKNSGLAESASILSIKKPTGETENAASPLSGGETRIRVFLKLSDPAVGSTYGGGSNEAIEIRPTDSQSIFSQGAKSMKDINTTGVIKLRPNFPRILNAQLANDNSYIDLSFDFGVYGDINHTSPITKEYLHLGFYSNGGKAYNADIREVTKCNSENSAEAFPLEGGETEVRIFLDIMGVPSGTEEIFVQSVLDKPLYNYVGNPINYHSEKTEMLKLNGIPSFIRVTPAEDLSYIDMELSTPVYGDPEGNSPVGIDDFYLVLKNNEVSQISAEILAIKKDNSINMSTASTLKGGETVLRFFVKITGDPVGNETLQLKVAGGSNIYGPSGNPMPDGSISTSITMNIPEPKIISTQLDLYNKYIDITFNTGIYGDSSHLNPVNREDFTLIHHANGGNATIVDLVDVRRPDAAEIGQSSLLEGGERVVRIFLSIPTPATGEETIEIKAGGDETIFSYSGLPMNETEITGIIYLNHIARIMNAEMSADNTYVDLYFSTGIYGSHDRLTPAVKENFSLSLNIDTEGCGLTQAEITSVKKPDNTSEESALPLTGGETVIRFFLTLTGNETKNDNIIIGSKDGNSLYDQWGTAVPVERTTGAIYFNERELNMLSLELAEGNHYIDVYFSTGVYGNTNGKTAVDLSNFALRGDSTIIQFSSITKPDSINENDASPLEGGETVVRFFLKTLQHPGDDDKIDIIALKDDHPIYNSWGSNIKNASTDSLTLHNMRITIVSTEMEYNNRYLDVVFNKGIFNSNGDPVTGDKFNIMLPEGGTLEKIKIISLKQPDSKIEAEATPLKGGENKIRVFLELQGSLSGEETFDMYVSHVEDEKETFAGYRIEVEDIHLLPPTPELVSSVFVKGPELYVDITFNTPVFYYISNVMGPLTTATFKVINFNETGTDSQMEIIGVKKPDSETLEKASPLDGGEKTVRVFLMHKGSSNGKDKFRIWSSGYGEIVAWDKRPINPSYSTQFYHPEPNLPVFTGVHSPGGMNYLDISFNYGVYSYDFGYDSPIQRECFVIGIKDPDNSLSIVKKSFRKPDHEIESEASPLVGGEKTIRAFFDVTGEYTGDETIYFQNSPLQLVYSYIQGERRIMLDYELSEEYKIPAPELKIKHVGKVIPVDAFLQYVDMSFSGGVYGDADGTQSIDGNAFILELKNNQGEITRVTPYVLTINNENLIGGEKSVRVYFRNTDENNVTMTIRPEESSIFNITGTVMKVTEEVSDIRLVKVHPRLIGTSIGMGNKYMDLYFDRPVRSIDQDALSLDDFEFVLKENGGNVNNVVPYHLGSTDGEEWDEASLPDINGMAFRIFMKYEGTPTGVETIEIKAKSGAITDSIGNAVPFDISTGLVSFVTPYPSTMEDSYTEGWMNGFVSRSTGHTLVVDTNGDITAFGSNLYGECDVPEDLELVKTAAAGDYFSVALKKNGQLSVWGKIKATENVWGVKSISHSKYGVFALRYDGSIAFIGNHEFRFEPENQQYYYEEKLDIPVEPLEINDISADYDNHLYILKKDGTIVAFDYNPESLEYGKTMEVPVHITDVKELYAGYGYCLVIKNNGTVDGWGDINLAEFSEEQFENVVSISMDKTSEDGGFSVLRRDGTANSYKRRNNYAVSERYTDLLAICGGSESQVVIRKDGSIAYYENGNLVTDIPQINIFKHQLFGELVQSDEKIYVEIHINDISGSPIRSAGIYGSPGFIKPVAADDFVVDIIKGSQNLMHIGIDSIEHQSYDNGEAIGGGLWVRLYLKIYGTLTGGEQIKIRPKNDFSVYGDAHKNLISIQSTEPMSLNEIESKAYLKYEGWLDAGWAHGVAMKETGHGFPWGDNSLGQAPSLLPVSNIYQVSAGYYFTNVILKDGTVTGWGDNSFGQLDMPKDLGMINYISSGGYHVLALDSNDQVIAWGSNQYNQSVVPEGLNSVISIAAGGNHSLALKKDGTVVAWGDNYFRQCDVPEGLKDIIAIAAGDNHSLALKKDGTVIGWGDNSSYQINIPEGLKDVLFVKAGYAHSLAIKKDGTLIAWGDNSKGQCDIPENLENVVAVTGGKDFTIVMEKDGTLHAWGDNTKEQCEFPVAANPPKLLEIIMNPKNRYVDLVFNKGVYGDSTATTPVSLDNFIIEYLGNSETEDEVIVTITSLKSANEEVEGQASELFGGENRIRLFIQVEGKPEGIETIKIRANKDKMIYDIFSIPVNEDMSDEVNLIRPYNDITRESGYFKGSSSTRIMPIEYYNAFGEKISEWHEAWGYYSGDSNTIEWKHIIENAGGNDRLLLVTLSSFEPNKSNQVIEWVSLQTYPGLSQSVIPMKHIATYYRGNYRDDIYYLLDKEMPYPDGEYFIKAKYRGPNRAIYSTSYSYINVAQMPPENIEVFDTELTPSSHEKKTTSVTTLTDRALTIEEGYFYTKTASGKEEDLGGISQITLRGDSGTYITEKDAYEGAYRGYAVSFRNSIHGTELPSNPLPPVEPIKLPNFPEANNIAFEKRSFTGSPIQFGDKIIIYDDKNIYMSDNGEEWAGPYEYPGSNPDYCKSYVYVSDDKLLTFKLDSEKVTVNTSFDGVNWTSTGYNWPVISDEEGDYTYFEYGEIVDFDWYKDPATGQISMVGVGNVWIGQFDTDGNIKKRMGKDGWSYDLRTPINIWISSQDNGNTWTVRYKPEFFFDESLENLGKYGARLFLKVLSNSNGIYVAFDNQKVHFSSDKGISWIEAESFEGINYGNPYKHLRYFTDVFVHNNMFIATAYKLNDKLNIYWTTDGVEWTAGEIGYVDPKFKTFNPITREYYNNYTTDFQSMAYANNTYATVHENTIAESVDGKTWNLYYCDFSSYKLESYNNRFYRMIKYETQDGMKYQLLGSDNLRDWYFESTTGSVGSIYKNDSLSINGKVIVGSGEIATNKVVIGYSPLPIVFVAPNDKDTHVPVNSILMVKFNDEIKEGSSWEDISLKDSQGNSVAIDVTIDWQNGMVRIIPQETLLQEEEYELFIPEGSVKDKKASKTNKQRIVCFKTGVSEVPMVMGTNIGEEGLSVESPIELYYSREIKIGSQVQYDRISLVKKNEPGKSISIYKDINGNKLVITPVQPLSYETEYILAIPEGSIEDNFENSVLDWPMEFETSIDAKKPFIYETNIPAHGIPFQADRVIEIIFSEEVVQSSNFENITLKNIRSVENTSIQVELENILYDDVMRTKLKIWPLNGLTFFGDYILTIPSDAVKDNVGNVLENEQEWEFIVENKAGYPILIGLKPMNLGTLVKLSDDIIFYFDKPIKATVNFNEGISFEYIERDEYGYEIARYDIEFKATIKDNKIIITPDRDPDNSPYYYKMDSSYEVKVKSEAFSNIHGNTQKDQVYTTGFATERINILATSPENGQTNIPLNGLITIEIDNYDVSKVYSDSQFYQISLQHVENKNGTKIYTKVPVGLYLKGRTIYIAPVNNLEPDTEYRVDLPRNSVSIGANITNVHYTFDFVTGSVMIETGTIDITGETMVGDSIIEGTKATFTPNNSPVAKEDIVSCVWSYGDNLYNYEYGPVGVHTYTDNGIFQVFMIATDKGGKNYLVRREVNVLKRPGISSLLMEVTPEVPVSLTPGEAVEFTAQLSMGYEPVIGAKINAYRTYPSTGELPPEHLGTYTTDGYGRITCKATFPEEVSQYYIQFIYEDEYEGVPVKKEARRILKNAIGKVEISGYVKNNFNVIIPNAQVIIGTTSVFTDETGFYKISNLDVGSYKISVRANNHYDFQDTAILSQKSTIKNMSLTRRAAHGNPIVRYVLLNDTLPSRNQNLIFYKGIDLDLDLFALIDWKGHEPGYVQFNLNGKIHNRLDARISLKVSDLEEGGKLTITCVTKSGEKSPEYNSGIYVVDSLPTQFPATFVPTYIDGKYVVDQYMKLPDIKTPNIAKIPLFAGGPFALFADPALITGAMSHDGSFHAFMGHSTDTGADFAYTKNNKLQKYIMEKYAETEEQKENIKKGRSRTFVGSASMDSTLDASFFWHYDVKTSKWIFEYSEMMLGYNANLYAKYSWGVPGVPASVYLSANVDVGLDSRLIGDYYTPTTLSYTAGTVDLNKFKITMSGGIDATIASASVNFSGEGKVKIYFPEYKRNYYIGVKGWVNLKALLWSVDLPFLEYEWGDPSAWNLKKSSERMNTLNENSTIMGIAEGEIDNLKPMARDYINTQSSWLSGRESKLFSINNVGMGTYSSQDGSSELMTGTIPYTDHNVIPYGDGAFMVFTQDDTNRSDLNRTRSVYTIYNGNAWSEPLPIDPSDQTGDFKPKIAATNKGVIATWENIGEVLPEGAELGEALKNEEIAVAVFDRETGTWSGVQNLTSDKYMDMSPEIAADEDKGMVVWIKGKAIDYSDALTADFAPENHIMFSSFDGHTFSEPVSIYQTDNLIVNTSLAYEGDRAAYVFSLDMDKDLGTGADQEIFIMTYDGSEWSAPRRITEDNLKDTNSQVSYLNGKPFLVWHRDGKIVYVKDASSDNVVPKLAKEDTKLQENFILAARNKNSDSIILTAPGVSEDSQEIYALAYDIANDKWSNELKLTDDKAVNRSPSAVIIDNTLITIYNRAHLEDVINPETGETFKYPGSSADMMMHTKELIHELEITSEDIILSDCNVYPGGLVTISAFVKNKGNFGETEVKVAFYNGDPSKDGKQIGETVVIEDVIAPGDVGIASIDWDVPVEGLLDEIYVVVDPSGSINDVNPLNNKAFIKLIQPDIELSLLEAEPMGGSNYAVKVKVSNIGSVDLPDSTITFYRGTGESEIEEIGEINTGELLVGDVKEIPYLINLPSTWFINSSLDLIATVDAPLDYTEQVHGNNIRILAIIEEYPLIESYEPGDNAFNVRTDKGFSITFDRNIYKGDTFGGIALKDSDNNIIPVTTVIDGDVLTITPSQKLEYSREYSLNLPAMSVAGSNMKGLESDWSISFRTEENEVYPLITVLEGITPEQAISFPFSRDITSDVGVNLITMKKAGNGEEIAATYTIAGNVLEIEPLSDLEYNTAYTVAVPDGAIKDTGGMSVGSFDFVLTTLEKEPDVVEICIITFDKNGGDTQASPATKDVVLGENVGVLPTAPTRLGYTFNGWNTRPDGSGTTFTGATIVTGNVMVYAQWTLNNSEGGVIPPEGNESGTIPDTTKTGTTKTEVNVRGNTVIVISTIAADVDSEGNAIASAEQEQLVTAIDKALVEAGKQGEGKKIEIEIRVELPADTGAVETNIPEEALNQAAKSGIRAMTISTPVASIIFDTNTIYALSEEATGDLKFKASKVEALSLSPEAQRKVGDRPVFDLSVTSGDRTISNFEGDILVSIPYTPKKGEDTNAIVIYYINASGELEVVSNCIYDSETKRVSFSTRHFSQYVVGYNKVIFKDVKENAWYSKAIGFIAAREITAGTGGGNFSPDILLSRGEFIVMLMKAYGIAPDTDPVDNFEDAGNTYYTNYLAASKRLGISNGTGSNMFLPDSKITRQEMFTLVYNALKAIDKLPEGKAGKPLSDFTDAEDITTWAKKAIALLVETGTISGNEGKLFPSNTTTRAEMAQVLYNLLSK